MRGRAALSLMGAPPTHSHRALGTNVALCGGCTGSGGCVSEHSATTGAPSIGVTPAVRRSRATTRGLDGKR
eukprot:4036556-Prymnesium_polylepis.1